MTMNATDAERCTDPRPPRIFIGRDETGAEHHYLTRKRAVVVISADGRRMHRQPLDDDNPIEQWVTFVGDRRGWADQRLYDSFGDQFASEVDA
jgi:hypothetical protein